MKNFKYYSALLLAATLTGCSNELGEPAVNPDYLEPGTAAMHITVGFPQPKSYAVGDEDATIATDAEKEIKSLAFFVKTSHAFAKLYSEDPLLSPNGFTEELTEVAKGRYTATFKVRSPQFVGDTEVIAIANYVENGLDFSNVTTIKQLKEMATVKLDGTKNLATPLLMYGGTTVTLVDQAVEPIELKMTRLVARLDVVNTAMPKEDDPDTTNGFTLTSVRLLNAPEQSTLLPDLKQTYPGVNLPTRTPAGTDTFVNYLYLYEALNGVGDKATQPMIEIAGTFRGTPVLREIPFKTADVPDLPGEYFAVQRNYRYILTITPADNAEELDFAITVKDWEKGDDIQVKPTQKNPKLENFATAGDLAAEGVTWDETTMTLTMTKSLTTDVTLTFDASAYRAPGVEIVADAVSGVSFIPLENVRKGDISGYAEGEPDEPMPLKRTFTLTLPKDVEALVTKGATTTNQLKILVSDKFATFVTVKYVDSREPDPVEPDPVEP